MPQPAAVTFAHFAYKDSTAVVSGETCPNTNSSISGLAFYTGDTYPQQYRHGLFFADYSRRCIWVMYAGAGGVPDPASRATFVQSAGYPVDLQTGPGGDLFYVDLTEGSIHRIRYTALLPPTAVIESSALTGPAPLTVTFDGRQSSDPDGTALSYSWDLDGDGVFGDADGRHREHTYSASGEYEVRLRVTDRDESLACRTSDGSRREHAARAGHRHAGYDAAVARGPDDHLQRTRQRHRADRHSIVRAQLVGLNHESLLDSHDVPRARDSGLLGRLEWRLHRARS